MRRRRKARLQYQICNREGGVLSPPQELLRSSLEGAYSETQWRRQGLPSDLCCRSVGDGVFGSWFNPVFGPFEVAASAGQISWPAPRVGRFDCYAAASRSRAGSAGSGHLTTVPSAARLRDSRRLTQALTLIISSAALASSAFLSLEGHRKRKIRGSFIAAGSPSIWCIGLALALCWLCCVGVMQQP